MKKTIGLLALLFITFLQSLTSCSNKAKTENNGKPTVTVTIEPIHYFVDQIAGGKENVNVMVPAGSNPETYEPTAQQMVALAESDIYFKVGKIGFEETWMKKLTDNAPHIKVIDTSTGITPAKTAHGIEDPHTWMSCTSAAVITQNICKALGELLPKDRAFFEKQRQKFLAETVKKVTADMTPYFAKAKEARREQTHIKEASFPFVIYHPALTYFSRDYGFEQIPIEEEGREPSIAQLQSLIERAKKEQIKTVFIQKEFANRNTKTFIHATKAQPIEINPLSYDWDQQMINIAKAIAKSYDTKNTNKQ